MDDGVTSVAEDGAAPAVDTTPPKAADVHRSVKVLRVWLIVLTVVVVVLVGVAGAGVYAAWSYYSMFNGWAAEGPDADQTTALEGAVKSAYRDALESVKVTELSLERPSAAGPFGAGYMPRVYSIVYRIKGVSSPFAGLASTPEDLDGSGLIPTEGSLSSRLELEQVVSLAAAFKAESDKPIGGMSAYYDNDYVEGQSPPAVIDVAGKEYQTKTLWAVAEGSEPPADKKLQPYGMDDVRALIFHRDPATGAWTYLGTERRPPAIPF